MEAKTVTKTWQPTVAGILTVLDGSFSVLVSLGLFVGSILLWATPSWAEIVESDSAPLTAATVGTIVTIIAVVILALAILELLGGISALQRKRWGLALAGSIAAALPGNVLGILAIIFLAMSKNEFD
jgi:hypothetical protein